MKYLLVIFNRTYTTPLRGIRPMFIKCVFFGFLNKVYVGAAVQIIGATRLKAVPRIICKG